MPTTYTLTRDDIVAVYKRWIETANYELEPSKDAEENADYFIEALESVQSEQEGQ